MRMLKTRWGGRLILIVLLPFLLTACGQSGAAPTATSDQATEAGGVESGDDRDQSDHIPAEVPDEYSGLTNPLSGDQEAVSAGNKLFISNCATCHGETGDGDGPASQGLVPKPASLSNGEIMDVLSDGYIYWRIAEGGTEDPFNSAMPSWKGIFGEDQIWQLVTYIRSLSK